MGNSKEEIDSLKPEDSWPQAEKLLDQHFRKRRLILLLFFFGAAILLTAGGWFAFRHDSGTTTGESSVVLSEQRNTSANEVAQNAPAAQEINSLQNSSKPEQKNVVADKNDESAAPGKVPKPDSRPQASSKNNPTELTVIHIENGKKKTPVVQTAKTKASETDIEVAEAVAFATTNLSSSRVNNSEINSGNAAEVKPAEITNREIVPPIALMLPVPGPIIQANDFHISLSDLKESDKTNKSCGNCQASVLFYVMPSYVTRELKSESHKAYTERRNKEESPAVMFAYGSAFTTGGRNFSISAGLEYAVYGEDVKYSPYSIQSVEQNNSYWDYNTITVVDTDTVYISGIRVFLETLVNHTDSLYISDLDTVKAGLYDANVSNANGKNRFYFVEIPIEVSWHKPVKKFTLGASVGVSPGWLVEEKGYYLKKDLSGVEQVSKHGSLNTFMMSARAGIDIRYSIGDRWSVFLKPRLKANLNSLFGDDSGISQKYYSTGVGAGFQYRLH